MSHWSFKNRHDPGVSCDSCVWGVGLSWRSGKGEQRRNAKI